MLVAHLITEDSTLSGWASNRPCLLVLAIEEGIHIFTKTWMIEHAWEEGRRGGGRSQPWEQGTLQANVMMYGFIHGSGIGHGREKSKRYGEPTQPQLKLAENGCSRRPKLPKSGNSFPRYSFPSMSMRSERASGYYSFKKGACSVP